MGSDAEVVLAIEGITKRFPGVTANADVSFDLHRGEIHCLLGENGAGKSTLMNVVFGLYQPDEGTITVNGQRQVFHSSRDAINVGIGMVHQHFQLIPVLTVAENVVLGNEIRKGPVLDLDTVRSRIRELSQTYGLAVPPDALVGELSVGEQQRVELVKALYRKADILILDEPTAVLTPGEVDQFFEVVRSLVDQGKSIVFITHKLREVLAVADRVTVLRGGRVVGSADPKASTTSDLATLMVGREVTFEVPKKPAEPGKAVLEVRDLAVADDRGVPVVAGCDLTVRAGEIFGLAGVEGNGQRELVEAITGMRKIVTGLVAIGGTPIGGRTPREVEELGVGHVPEDRSKHGVVAPFTIAENVALNGYFRPAFSRRGVLRRGAIAAHARRPGESLRRAHAGHRRGGRESLRRQPAEGRGRARAVQGARAAGGRAAHTRVGRRLHRVHPQPDRRQARRGRGGAAGVRRARRDPGAGRHHRRALPGGGAGDHATGGGDA